MSEDKFSRNTIQDSISISLYMLRLLFSNLKIYRILYNIKWSLTVLPQSHFQNRSLLIQKTFFSKGIHAPLDSYHLVPGPSGSGALIPALVNILLSARSIPDEPKKNKHTKKNKIIMNWLFLLKWIVFYDQCNLYKYIIQRWHKNCSLRFLRIIEIGVHSSYDVLF